MKRGPTLLLLATLWACAPSDAPLSILQSPEYGQRWVVINYWAIWCGPCRDEIPELNTLSYRGLVNVYAVNYDGLQGDELVAQALELDIQFPLLSADPGPALGSQRPGQLPMTLIVSPQGEMVARLFGPQTVASIEAEIARASRATGPNADQTQE